MINIEQKPYGYKIVLSGILSVEESKNWLVESKRIISNGSKSFSVFIDMQKIELLPVKCQEIMFEGQLLYKSLGMIRSVCIVSNKLTAMQFRLLAQKTGIYADERYINASFNPNWEKEGLNWILNAIEPAIEEELVK